MKGLLFVAVIAVSIAIGTSLRCYYCLGCGDPFNQNSARIVNCTNACDKIDSELSNGTVLTFRQCAYDVAGDVARKLELRAPVYVVSQTSNVCTGDLCNGANSMGSTSLMLSFVSIILAIISIDRIAY